MKKRRLRPLVVIIFFVICLIGVIYFSYKVLIWEFHVNENHKIQEIIKDKIIITEPNINDDNQELIDEIEENNNETQELQYNIDFKSLKDENPDTIAYLKVNNTDIEYIIVKGKDNSYYLKHNFEKKWNTAGWVFADYHNKFDETDKNIVIYGHSMKNGSMFGTLKNILTKDWYTNEENHKIVLVTEKGLYNYEVFSTYSIQVEDYYINTSFRNNDEFSSFVKKLKSRSIYNYGNNVTGEDKILTLSTCTAGGTKRVVLHAKLIQN